MPPRSPRRSRPPDLEARARFVHSFDASRFSVKSAVDLPDDAGIKYGDRVRVWIEGTCTGVIESTTRDGTSEREVVIEAYTGAVVKIIDEAIGPKRRRLRKPCSTPDCSGWRTTEKREFRSEFCRSCAQKQGKAKEGENDG